MNAEEFNLQAERYYRGTLRKQYQTEAFEFVRDDFARIDKEVLELYPSMKEALQFCLGDLKATEFLSRIERDLMEDNLAIDDLKRLINLMLVSLRIDMNTAEQLLDEEPGNDYAAPIH